MSTLAWVKLGGTFWHGVGEKFMLYDFAAVLGLSTDSAGVFEKLHARAERCFGLSEWGGEGELEPCFLILVLTQTHAFIACYWTETLYYVSLI